MIEFSLTKDEARTVLLVVGLARETASKETRQKSYDIYKILISQFAAQSDA